MAIELPVYALIPAGLTRRDYQELSVPLPEPSIEHTLTSCDECGAQSWIGPTQLLALTFNGGEKLCYRCVFRRLKHGDGFRPVRLLDATAEEKPRRRT